MIWMLIRVSMCEQKWLRVSTFELNQPRSTKAPIPCLSSIAYTIVGLSLVSFQFVQMAGKCEDDFVAPAPLYRAWSCKCISYDSGL